MQIEGTGIVSATHQTVSSTPQKDPLMRNFAAQVACWTLLFFGPVTIQAQETPKGEVTKYTFREQQDLSRHVPRLLGLRSEAVRPGQAGLRVRQSGRHAVQRPGGLRRADREEGDAGDDRRVRHARPGEGTTPIRRSTASTAASNTTAWATTTPASCSKNCCPTSRRRTTADGRAIKLSKDGNDRCIGGASSGAICAFTAAWERPDAFRRVFSAIGTYVGLRGGNDYPTLIRKYEPKPIRIFLQDGSNDLNIYGGDWWMANQEMERSLTFAGYEVEPRLGRRRPQRQARHRDLSRRHALALEGLARSRSRPAKARRRLQEILIPGEDWKLVGEGYKFTEGPAVNAKGEVFFNDVPATARRTRSGLDGKVDRVPRPTRSKATARRSVPTAGCMPSPAATEQIIAYDVEGKRNRP